MSRRPLTARGLRQILARAGVDHSVLTITDDPEVWVDVETGKPRTYVKITGPREARREVSWELFGRGFANAPYPDHDFWSR